MFYNEGAKYMEKRYQEFFLEFIKSDKKLSKEYIRILPKRYTTISRVFRRKRK